MFVFTAKLNKQRIIALVLLLGIVIAAVILLAGGGGSDSAPDSGNDVTTERPTKVRSNEERIQYLASYGWEVAEEPVETQDIVIPRDFSGAYSEYNELQLSQGFDLTKYCGESATRYTYAVLNYPTGEENILVDIVVCRSVVIAGDVLSPELGGFMHGLEMPE